MRAQPVTLESQREGKLLARLLGALVIGGSLSAVIQLAVLPDFFKTFLILMTAITLLGVAWIVTLLGYGKAAAGITIGVTSIASFGAIFTGSTSHVSIAFLVLPVLLTSLFFRPLPTALTALLLCAGVAVLPWIDPVQFAPERVTGLTVFLVIASALVVLAGWHRAALEELRRENLESMAMHDTLTGLHNRRAFEAALTGCMLSARSHNVSHALVYMDLDRFKLVNDTCGHGAGDELLRQLGQIFQQEVKPPHMFARLGGDEFAVLLLNTTVERAVEVAESISSLIADFRFIYENQPFDLQVSVGITEINKDSGSEKDILMAADQACYAAKGAGTRRIRVIESHDAQVEQYQREVVNVSEAVSALREDRMVLFGQPICATDTGLTAFTEVLVRMRDRDGRIVSPDEFLLGLERFRWMPVLDRWVVEHSLKALPAGARSSPSSGLPLISVNLSGQSISDDTLLPFILKSMSDHSVDPHAVCFEITETAAISSLSTAVRFMGELHTIGCKFALDDFGSGLSSFSYLRQLPVDFIKIAGPLVQGVENDPVARATTSAIANIAASMSLPVVAEWVENESALAAVKDMGIAYVQGYFTGRPEPLRLS